jgi:hypothetical protein
MSAHGYARPSSPAPAAPLPTLAAPILAPDVGAGNAADQAQLPEPAQARTPVLDAAVAQTAPVAPAVEARRVAAANLLAEIDREIGIEDDQTDGHAKPTLTRTAALGALLDAAHSAETLARTTPTEANVAALERAVQAALTRYRATPMSSRDGAMRTTTTSQADYLDAVSFSQLLAWQRADATQPWVKFAVPPPAAGGANRMRVGSPALHHNEVAGGEAIAAGLLRFNPDDGTVAELENTSGGYRPGHLRNATAAALLSAAHYTVSVHDNESGQYNGTGAVIGRF